MKNRTITRKFRKI